MKILHVSDTHGGMPRLSAHADVVVHSGDFLPNVSFGMPVLEQAFQPRWLEAEGARLRAWIGNRPFLFCPGNHDFVDPVPYLRAAGVDAHSICNTFLDYEGIGFYGFPWVPVCGPYGSRPAWNWMASAAERRARLAPAVELLNQGAIDVLVTHGPMRGVLDRNDYGERCGSRVLREVLQSARHPPKLLLHGHIHESAGILRWRKHTRVSNAACTQRILEIDT